jgi:hypothetical protein
MRIIGAVWKPQVMLLYEYNRCCLETSGNVIIYKLNYCLETTVKFAISGKDFFWKPDSVKLYKKTYLKT